MPLRDVLPSPPPNMAGTYVYNGLREVVVSIEVGTHAARVRETKYCSDFDCPHQIVRVDFGPHESPSLEV